MNTLKAISDGHELRHLFGRFPTGVTTLCAQIDGQPVGMTASAFVAISLNPQLVSVSIKRESIMWGLLRTCDRIGISFLGDRHAQAARQLAQKTADRFDALDYEVTSQGALFLKHATAWLECSVETEIEAGDHDIVLFRLHHSAVADNTPPLVFHSSTFHTLAPLWCSD